ncbi:1,4-dihydroxy-2-naphthoate polyprenyltransferase [Rhodohalobacter mucosus]|uniref:1,4-dihydroxy-2-naphthoate octaprenyltransferase n=1 Tax=Rhodohalobacter mucosus TaxID=2079485 RepID=A0A316TUJ1_9BACT|nr:1,4-dihydroxy-2-naphthoate polyprenyltransferase [Rhodohalobacter mucosus]PWN06949.1 1,4-dihydroxy-2-naphthoate octaprenyltransferase [Rhodohalobacter mucosus]
MNRQKILNWLRAARPQTLAAALVPVMTGSALAFSDGLFRWDTSLVALFCAFGIQIGTNFANDYFDFIKGADTPDRIGFERATSAGLIQPKQMLRAVILVMLVSFVAGLYLVWIGGWIILVVGLLSLLFGILYTGGPYPLGYNGLGDIFVFIFFGLVAVTATYYVNALQWSSDSLIASIPIGALCVNILVVNNLRDVEQDKISGKRTLGVLLGENWLKSEYILMAGFAYLAPLVMYYFYGYTATIFLPVLSLPFAALLIRQVLFNEDKRLLNKTLERTSQLMILYGVLFAAGILL